MGEYTGAQILAGCILIVGFAISCFVIYGKGTAFPDKGDCALPFEVANATTASLDKSIISQWRWTYEDEGQGLKIRAKCPSMFQDADLFYDGKLIGRTAGKVFNFEGSFDVLDCNGENMGRWSADNWQNRIENSLTYAVNSFLEKDGKIVGFIKGENFISTNIIIVDAKNGQLVASMTRDVITLEWTWEIVRYQPMHPAADWRFLLGIIGKESFAEDSDKNCICNQYFYGLLWTLVGVVGLIVCCLLCACCAVGPRYACDSCLSLMPCCDGIRCSCFEKDTSTNHGYESEGYGIGGVDLTHV